MRKGLGKLKADAEAAANHNMKSGLAKPD